MQLDPFVAQLRDQLGAAAAPGGEDARRTVERLSAALESAVRLTLLEALAAAADEITRELAPGSVAVRLRGRDPEFTVSAPPAELAEPVGVADGSVASPAGGGAELTIEVGSDLGGDTTGITDMTKADATVVRINLRLPEHLKARVEQAADRAGLSINSWLVRAAAAAVERDARPRPDQKHARFGGARVTGWVR